ncbi:MAG: hypothetical protein ABIK65_12830 [Candidatus Eisenbacteria bacterium]
MKKTVLLVATACLLFPVLARGDVEVKPYGFVLVNSSYSTDAMTDIPVLAPKEDTGNPNFLITPRQTRFGLKMKSDADYTPSGVIELDFWGLRGSGSNGGPTQSAPRLRRAFLELHFGRVALLAGQEWIVFSPLSPTSLMHTSLPGMMSSGNLWARLPQLRGTFKPIADDKNEFKIELALTRPFGGDGTMTPVSQGDVIASGELSRVPGVQGRFGYTMTGSMTLSIGAGGHFVREKFGVDPQGDDVIGTAYAVGGDLMVSAAKVAVSGEVFYGQNIKTLFSNATYVLDETVIIDQGGIETGRELNDVNEIKAFGGWGEIKVLPSEKWEAAVSVGIESVDDEFLSNGAVKTNLTAMGTVINKAVKGVKIGLEGGYIKTERIADDPATTGTKETDDGGTNLNGNLSFLFSF